MPAVTILVSLFPELQHLEVGGLHPADACSFLSSLASTRFLHLSGLRVTLSEESEHVESCELMPCLARFTSLTRLGVQLYRRVQAVMDVSLLSGLQHLQELSIETWEVVYGLQAVLSSCPKLTHLSLGSVRVVDERPLHSPILKELRFMQELHAGLTQEIEVINDWGVILPVYLNLQDLPALQRVRLCGLWLAGYTPEQARLLGVSLASLPVEVEGDAFSLRADLFTDKAHFAKLAELKKAIASLHALACPEMQSAALLLAMAWRKAITEVCVRKTWLTGKNHLEIYDNDSSLEL